MLAVPNTWRRNREDVMPKRKIDPIPEHFFCFEEASDFWDTHNAGDYEGYWRPVQDDLTLA